MKKNRPAIIMVLCVFLFSAPIRAEEQKDEIYDMGEIQVTAKGGENPVSLTPSRVVIDLEDYRTTGLPQNLAEIVRDQVAFDFRGMSDLVPDDDILFMRGFEAKRFTTAIDGSALRKTGGRKSSHIVDYALLPPFLMEKIEIIPGPHSALYPAKSIGGVLNFITKTPERHESLKPDVSLSAGYKSYNTQNHCISMQGGAGSFIYDAGYQKYSTDGYLRHTKADIDTLFGRIGYLFPSGGYLTFNASYTDADREITVNNDPDNPSTHYDDDYPVVAGSAFDEWQTPTWDKFASACRMNLNLPTSAGLISGNAYYSKENRDRSYDDRVDAEDHDKGIKDASFDTVWRQQGIGLQDEIRFSDRHVTTLGADLERCYDGYGRASGRIAAHDEKKKIEIMSGFLQHSWRIMPRLTLDAGLRYEDVSIWITNHNTTNGRIYITGRPLFIERSWGEWIPKSFLTCELDDLGEILRDTSLSLGVSRIWRAPDYHGDYNPQGRPAGAWLEPEHGTGFDLIFKRRIFGDIRMKLGYACYEIKDYIATNSEYAKYTPSKTNKVTPGLEFMDYKVNLEKVVRHGLELEFNGHLTESLSFYLGYAFQKFESKGNEPAGETELDAQAENRINAGLRWKVSQNTLLLLDYEFQDDQVIEKADEIAPDEWLFEDVSIDARHLIDFGLQHTLFKEWGMMQNGKLKVYVDNLFDEKYSDTEGYPATDRTFGIGFSVGF